mgnify:CR=1 FL=1
MTRQRIYLDHNATMVLRPCARAAMMSALDEVVNPSSVHQEGRRARRVIEDAREQIAELAGARPSEVVFTSGATEANVWVMRAGWDAVAVSAIEHPSVLVPAKAADSRVWEVGASATGVADVGAFADLILGDEAFQGRRLVSLQAANNETGVIQPIADVAAFCRAHDVCFHTDAVQLAGRRKLDFGALGADLMSLSAHKIGGPMGVGALIIRDGSPLSAMISGGGQERSRRSGTENFAGIAGFGAAAEAAGREVAEIAQVGRKRDQLEAGGKVISPDAIVIGQAAERLANTSCLALPGRSAETTVIKLDLAGIAVSAGSACSSGKVGASHVLATMGLADEDARSVIRVSIGWNTTDADISAFLAAWRTLADGQQRDVA